MRYVRSEKSVSTKHEKFGEVEVMVEVPQIESPEEAISFAGGPDSFVEYTNSSIETGARNGARAVLRALPETAFVKGADGKYSLTPEATSRVQRVAHDYAPTAGSRAPGKAKKAAAFDSIKALVESGQEFTKEQLLEMLAAAK